MDAQFTVDFRPYTNGVVDNSLVTLLAITRLQLIPSYLNHQLSCQLLSATLVKLTYSDTFIQQPALPSNLEALRRELNIFLLSSYT